MRLIATTLAAAWLCGMTGAANAQTAEELAGGPDAALQSAPEELSTADDLDAIAALPAGTQLPVLAEITTLQDAISVAMSRNPGLDSQRAARAIADETLTQARAGFRPSVGLSTSAGYSRSDSGAPAFFGTGTQGVSESTSGTIGLEVSQSLYAGGGLRANVDRAKAGVEFSDAQLAAASQGLILNVITAYLDVVTDQAAMDIRRNNVDVLRTQVEAANDRFRVGEVTRTDVAQAEARLAGAMAQQAQARAQLEASRAIFRQTVGLPAGELSPTPDADVEADTIEAAIARGHENNPNILQSKAALEAARELVKSTKAQRKPNVSVVGAAGWVRSHAFSDLTGITSDYDTSNVEATVRARMPLYQGGLLASQVREAQLEETRSRLKLRSDELQLVSDIAQIWHALLAAQEGITASRQQVSAAEVAFQGAEQELAVGLRTTLDVLDQEQELLEARLTLIEAERTYYLAQHQLLALVGDLTPEHFGVNIPLYTREDYSGAIKNR